MTLIATKKLIFIMFYMILRNFKKILLSLSFKFSRKFLQIDKNCDKHKIFGESTRTKACKNLRKWKISTKSPKNLREENFLRELEKHIFSSFFVMNINLFLHSCLMMFSVFIRYEKKCITIHNKNCEMNFNFYLIFDFDFCEQQKKIDLFSWLKLTFSPSKWVEKICLFERTINVNDKKKSYSKRLWFFIIIEFECEKHLLTIFFFISFFCCSFSVQNQNFQWIFKFSYEWNYENECDGNVSENSRPVLYLFHINNFIIMLIRIEKESKKKSVSSFSTKWWDFAILWCAKCLKF